METNHPFLKDIEAVLQDIFNLPDYHPTAGNCHLCADEVGKILLRNAFQVDIVQIQHKMGIGSNLFVRKPEGGEWLIAQNGWHQVVRIWQGEVEFFIDSIVFQHHGVTALSKPEYSDLWGADADYMVYFRKRLPGEEDVPRRILRPQEIYGDVIALAE
jgi:hypothetical protein